MRVKILETTDTGLIKSIEVNGKKISVGNVIDIGGKPDVQRYGFQRYNVVSGIMIDYNEIGAISRVNVFGQNSNLWLVLHQQLCDLSLNVFSTFPEIVQHLNALEDKRVRVINAFKEFMNLENIA